MGDPVADDLNKSHVIHHGTETIIAHGYHGHSAEQQIPIDYVVDKDGNIHKLAPPNSNGIRLPSDDTTPITDEHGNVITSGSQQAKDIYNNTDPNDPNKYDSFNTPVTPDPPIVPYKQVGDQILAIPEQLVNAGLNWSIQADFILKTTGDLDKISQGLYHHLTDHTKVNFDNFWQNWQKVMLNMASSGESVAVLLSNAAVAYIEADEKILTAFHGDPAAEKQIEDEIQQIKDQQTDFKKNFQKEVDNEKAIENQYATDKAIDDKEHVIHKETDDAHYVFQNNGGKGGNADYANRKKQGRGPLKYMMDKDGNIYPVHWNHDHYEEDKGNTIDLEDAHGHVIKSGSQEAKDLFNKTDPNDPNKMGM